MLFSNFSNNYYSLAGSSSGGDLSRRMSLLDLLITKWQCASGTNYMGIGISQFVFKHILNAQVGGKARDNAKHSLGIQM